MTHRYRVWGGDQWIEVPVPPDDELTMVPNVNALVYRSLARHEVLLQRRDKAGEIVRGLWEVPGGRWAAGEPPDVALAREVAEEAGLELLAVAGAVERVADQAPRIVWISRPVAVVSGGDGAYPSLHVVFECYAAGEPRPHPGEAVEPTWWDVDELRAHMTAHPEDFIAQSLAVLRAGLPPVSVG